jgi:homoserine kinase type II
MLWESVDPQQALASRFKFNDAAQVGEWVSASLADVWGVEVISCDRVVLSAHNALVWVTSPAGRMIAKWSAVPSLFPRLANVAQLTSWLSRRGLPVSAPVPAVNGDLQVELDGFSLGVQSVVDGSMLDADNPAQVQAAGRALAALHATLADHPGDRLLGAGGQGDQTPLHTRVESWLDGAASRHVAALGRSLRRRLPSLPPDATLRSPQLVHLDIRSANLLCNGRGIAAVLDFEDAGTDYPVYDLANACVLLGTRFRRWGPVSVETHRAFVAGYEAVRELSPPEKGWLKDLVLWRTLQFVPAGDDPTGWAESANQLSLAVHRDSP